MMTAPRRALPPDRRPALIAGSAAILGVVTIGGLLLAGPAQADQHTTTPTPAATSLTLTAWLPAACHKAAIAVTTTPDGAPYELYRNIGTGWQRQPRITGEAFRIDTLPGVTTVTYRAVLGDITREASLKPYQCQTATPTPTVTATAATSPTRTVSRETTTTPTRGTSPNRGRTIDRSGGLAATGEDG